MKTFESSLCPPGIQILSQNTFSKNEPVTISISKSPAKYPLFKSKIFDHASLGKRSVADILEDRVSSPDFVDGDTEDAFFVADLGQVVRQFQQWKRLLPRVEPFYAVKCNPDPMVLQTLNNLGTGFDCASKAEIQAILDQGIDPSRIIYANPCKQSSHIRYAATKGVNHMTFDNVDELHKIKKIYPDAKLVLRILADDSRSICKLGLKFGAPLHLVPQILSEAKSLELDVVGVSFHVGSGCFDASAFTDAVLNARSVFDVAEQMGFDFKLLDIGGGFPGSDKVDGISFREIATRLAPLIDELFPPSVRVIAEPGRYFVSAAFTIAVNICSRRVEGEVMKSDSTNIMYYVNDGVYGSFNCIMFDHIVVSPKILQRDGAFLYGKEMSPDEPGYKCSIWGPTCDSIDIIVKDGMLPKLDVGDWLYFDEMGAYTICAASQFNGFKKSSVIYTNTFE
ncbi:hypothetical protein HK098_001385 [Nowakowskiella sp. JEL0407]|nr:hypothetical protein HK098_001385 [Nowakowskiella sp. JEL0407]